MLGGAVLFAVMATFVGLAHRQDPTLDTLVTSAVRSSVNLGLLVAIAGKQAPTLWGDGRRALWVRGLFGGVALMTYFASLQHLSLGEAAFLNQTAAIWVVLAAPFVLGERPSPVGILAVLGSIVGIALLAHPRAGDTDTAGRIFGLVSGVTSAGAYLSIRKASATNRPAVIVFYFTLVATVLSTGLAIANGVSLPRDPLTIAFLVASGAAATFAQLLMTQAYRLGPTAAVAAAGACGPLLNVLGGWLVLGQIPDDSAGLGMGILLVTSMVMPFYAR